jgi:sterol desaturase/sphingolipid hydroxylase (fatty acid hydroxylase superfamily)
LITPFLPRAHNNFLFYFISNFIRRKSISYLGAMRWFIVYLLYYDFFYYFMHRLLHTRYFYPIHKIHHQKYNPDYRDFYNVQVIEVPLTSVGLFLAMCLHKIYIYQLISCILFINARGVIEHDARGIFLVGEHHLEHHKYICCNYGEYWMDYIFGTARPTRRIVN